jgi:uncharacterized protein (TIGR00369 family)
MDKNYTELEGLLSGAQDMLALGKEILAAQPFSRLLGAEITELAAGRAVLTIPLKHELKQQHGFVHGGVISYVADNALGFAGASVLGESIVTSEFKINYVRPAIGDHLVARATVVHSGRRQAVCRCDIFVASEEGEQLCATSQGTVTLQGRAPEAA